MNSQKRENLLNLALDATEEERAKSLELDVGYEPIEREWDLIVKYSGSLEAVRELGAEVTELSNEYAVLTIPESRLEALTGLPQIEYVEKPKRLFFQAENTRRVSCITAVQRPPYSLYGQGVLIGIVDSGIDLANPAFQDQNGGTRILNLWDQTIPGNPPQGYVIGTEYTKEEIENGQIPSRDVTGHGTAVAGIAAGNGAGSEGNRYAGMAPQSELIIVKLGNPRQDNFPRTTELMQGIDYVLCKAREYGRPVAMNVSFGNTYGSHVPSK